MKIVLVAAALLGSVIHPLRCEPPRRSCEEYIPALVEYAPPAGWDVERMARIMWRESNCRPDVRSRTRDTGLLQINDVNLPFLRRALGEWIDRWSLMDPVQNIRAAATLYQYWADAGRDPYRPWAL